MKNLKLMKFNRFLLAFNVILFIALAVNSPHNWFYYYNILIWTICFICINITIKKYKQ